MPLKWLFLYSASQKHQFYLHSSFPCYFWSNLLWRVSTPYVLLCWQLDYWFLVFITLLLSVLELARDLSTSDCLLRYTWVVGEEEILQSHGRVDATLIQRLRHRMLGSLLVGPCPASCFYLEGNMDRVVFFLGQLGRFSLQLQVSI